MWRPLSRGSPSPGVECESKSQATFSFSPLLSAYDSRGELQPAASAAVLLSAVMLWTLTL